MKTPYFIENIDWTDLRTQKDSLLSAITKAEETGNNEFVNDLYGILDLIDSLQDFAVDEMDVDAMHVFDFELEDEREGHYHNRPIYENADMTDSKGNELSEGDDVKIINLCDNCGSDNVQTKMWVNVNDNTISDSASDNDNGDNWCLDCETHPDLLPHTLKSDAKVIGFQVVGEEHSIHHGEIHNKMDASFCIYNLSQANVMIGHVNDWRLLTIWEGDIEEPTYMFEGDPRN